MTKDAERDAKGKFLSDGIWTYKSPTLDMILRKFNVGSSKVPPTKNESFLLKVSLAYLHDLTLTFTKSSTK